MKAIVSKLALAAVFAVSLSCRAVSAGAPEWFDVPVMFAGDRKHPGYKDVYKAVGQDQACGTQSIWFGELHLARNVSGLSEDERNALLKAGCEKITEKEASQSKYRELKKQYPESTMGVSCNIDAYDGKKSVFEIFPMTNWLAELKTKLPGEKGKLIIFAHGCCMDQKEAFDTAADLLVNTRQPVLLYDWSTVSAMRAPMLPEVNSYRRSERAVETSQVNFSRMVEQICKSIPAERIDLVGHSMGNRLLITALESWDAEKRGQFHQIHLVKPDVSMQAFLLEEAKICEKTKEAFIYCSSKDTAISSSEVVSFGIPRLGSPGTLKHLLESGRARAQKHSACWFIDVSREHAGLLGHGIPYALIGAIENQNLVEACKKFHLMPTTSDSRLLVAGASNFSLDEALQAVSGALVVKETADSRTK